MCSMTSIRTAASSPVSRASWYCNDDNHSDEPVGLPLGHGVDVQPASGLPEGGVADLGADDPVDALDVEQLADQRTRAAAQVNHGGRHGRQ